MKITKNYLIENKLIRKGSEIIISELQEAFGSGKASSVAEKLFNILGRKLGMSFNFSEIPMGYENSFGTFAGYLGLTSDGLCLRINFKLSGSDSIESFDLFLSGISDQPDVTVETNGLNIIQIVDLISETLVDENEVDEYVLEESTIQERSNFSKPEEIIYILEKWVTENKDIISILQKKAVPEIFSDEWQTYVSDKPNYKEIKYYIFSKALKQFLLGRGMTNKTYRARKNGSKERQIEDPILASQIDDIVAALSWKEKFAFIDLVVEDATKGKTKSIIVKGSPGSGKTHQVLQTLDSLNADYRIYSGGVKNLDALILLLYKHADADDRVLVFDDFDSVLSQVDSSNIFKAILQDSPERIITYVDVGRDTKKNMKDIPQRFIFKPSIIFITNKTKMDSAIESRSIVLDITLTNDEMLEKIEDTLESYRPEVDMSMKRTALEFCQEIAKGVKTLDFRMMDNVLRAMQLSPANWKKIALWMMKSV